MQPAPHNPTATRCPPVARSRQRAARRRRPGTGVILLILLAAFAGCQGYQVGNSTLYRTDIRTVHVPVFRSNSLRPDLGEWLTEAVVKEIELRTPYKVVHDPLSDSILTGRIVLDRKQVKSENINDEPRTLEYEPTVNVTWIDSRGCILMQSTIQLDAGFVPEAGQSITSAQQSVMRRLAAQIVSQMEAQNW
jgi:hypothetical protein